MRVELLDAVFGYARRAVVRVGALSLVRGRCVGIFGPNGVGKTTLIRGLAGLIDPLAGSVFREPGIRFGYLPQHRAMELHWPMSALDVALLAMSARRRFGWTAGASRGVREQLSALGVAHLVKKSFATLSGGQQQRVLLAGALAARPQVLILDEPTDGLDVQSRRILIERLLSQMSEGLAVVLVSHEPRDLLALHADIHVLEPSEREAEPSVARRIDADHLVEHVIGGDS